MSLSLTFVHQRLSTAVYLLTAIAGLWGVALYLRHATMTGQYWGILACLQVLFVAQAGVGVALWLSGSHPARSLHFLYGIVSLISLPGFYLASRGREDRRATLNFALICFFLLGISLRAATTGQ